MFDFREHIERKLIEIKYCTLFIPKYTIKVSTVINEKEMTIHFFHLPLNRKDTVGFDNDNFG